MHGFRAMRRLSVHKRRDATKNLRRDAACAASVLHMRHLSHRSFFVFLVSLGVSCGLCDYSYQDVNGHMPCLNDKTSIA